MSPPNERTRLRLVGLRFGKLTRAVGVVIERHHFRVEQRRSASGVVPAFARVESVAVPLRVRSEEDEREEPARDDITETVTAAGVIGSEFMELFTSEAGTFTITMRRMDGTSCIIAGGKGFALADRSKMKGPGL